jgi:hypothetical protein
MRSHMLFLNHFRVARIASLMALAALGGCASMSAKDCQKTDWNQRGLADGRWGASSSTIKEHAEACAKVKVVPDESAWHAGYDEGVKSYCNANSGWNRGTLNESYRGACVGLDESTFLRYHSAGQQLYKARQELRQANERQKKLESDYKFTNKDDVKRRLREDMQRADREHARLMALVAVYELAGPPR